MRKLTEEELRKCPDGFLEYGFNRSGGVFFFDRNRGVGVVCGGNLELKLSKGHYAFYECKPIPKPKKPFDITKHEFSDERISFSDTLDVDVGCDAYYDDSIIEVANYDFNKKDAIAIAKHFGLTIEDLK